MVLRIEEEEQQFVFEGVAAKPVPSLLRGFSAPVKLDVVGQSDADLAHLLAHDTDLFNRWEASQLLAKKLLLSMYEKAKACPEVRSADPVTAAKCSSKRAVHLQGQLCGPLNIE